MPGWSSPKSAVVSPYGIFVIETKNYQGWIYGSEHAEKWTQNIFGNKHELVNPLLQNDTHIRALRKLLSAHKYLPFISIVTFPAKADVRVDATEGQVVYWSQLVHNIKNYHERHGPHGRFYSCSNYPRCKFTLNID